MTHTPTPWAIGRKNKRTWVITGHGKDVASVAMNTYTENNFNEGNAAFIVRAANSHDELVAMLEKARSWIVELMPDSHDVLKESLRATIQKAKGQ